MDFFDSEDFFCVQSFLLNFLLKFLHLQDSIGWKLFRSPDSTEGSFFYLQDYSLMNFFNTRKIFYFLAECSDTGIASFRSRLRYSWCKDDRSLLREMSSLLLCKTLFLAAWDCPRVTEAAVWTSLLSYRYCVFGTPTCLWMCQWSCRTWWRTRWAAPMSSRSSRRNHTSHQQMARGFSI